MGAVLSAPIKFFLHCFLFSICDNPACRIARIREATQNRMRILEDTELVVKFIMGLYQSRTEKVRNASDSIMQRCDKILKNFMITLLFISCSVRRYRYNPILFFGAYRAD